MKRLRIPRKEVWLWILMLFVIESLSIDLNLKTYPDQKIEHVYGEDVVIQCRDEGSQRVAVTWIREDSKPIKAGSVKSNGRLEIDNVSMTDAGTYVCRATEYSKYPGSKTVQLIVKERKNELEEMPLVGACPPDSATCSDGTCIKKSSMCDFQIDCPDGLDEVNCGTFCEPDQLQCTNLMCVAKEWLCDGTDDCGDNSDEEYCGSLVAPPGECLSNEFKCEDMQCVPKSYRCDGRNDCLDDSDEYNCEVLRIVKPPTPEIVRVKSGQNFTLTCEAAGIPIPLISWRLNTGPVPEHCTSTSEEGVGVLTCQNVQPEDTGAYSCEANNNKELIFASPDAAVNVTIGQVCPDGFFNRSALSNEDCVQCFCFGHSMQCRSSELFKYRMRTSFSETSIKLRSVKLSDKTIEVLEDESILDQYTYVPLFNRCLVHKISNLSSSLSSNISPYLALPDTYKGNHLKSYGGHIRCTYTPDPIPSSQEDDDKDVPYIIIKGKHITLVYYHKGEGYSLNVRLTPEHWKMVSSDGIKPASRDDIMMALYNIEMILLRGSINGASVVIMGVSMDSADFIDDGEGTADLVEECTCSPGYKGLSCEDCASGFVHLKTGLLLGNCVPQLLQCQIGFYKQEGSSICIPCPCPSSFQSFASNCSVGSNGSVACDCKPGYGGEHCEYCEPGYEGNPLVPGGSCEPTAGGTNGSELVQGTMELPLSADVIVRIVGAPVISKKVGRSVNWTCEARDLSSFFTSFPVEWGKVDGELPLGKYQFDSRTGMLLIENLQLSDSGIYICSTRAGAGPEAIANLKVYPDEADLQNGTMSVQEQDVTIAISVPIQIKKEGSNISFTCQAYNRKTSLRLPVMWTRAEGKLPQGRNQVDLQTGSLLIYDVQFSDNGTYSCHAYYNENNYVTANSELKILGNPDHYNSPMKLLPKPSITVQITSPSLVTEYVGENFNFTCEAHSWINSTQLLPYTYRRLPMTWIKVGGTLPEGRHKIDGSNGLLRLTNLQLFDSGMYACIASDGINVVQALATLEVVFDIELRS